jgi:hypothetical protein
MAGLVPAIHAFDDIHLMIFIRKQDVDARDKRGHDGSAFKSARIRCWRKDCDEKDHAIRRR